MRCTGAFVESKSRGPVGWSDPKPWPGYLSLFESLAEQASLLARGEKITALPNLSAYPNTTQSKRSWLAMKFAHLVAAQLGVAADDAARGIELRNRGAGATYRECDVRARFARGLPLRGAGLAAEPRSVGQTERMNRLVELMQAFVAGDKIGVRDAQELEAAIAELDEQDTALDDLATDWRSTRQAEAIIFMTMST